VLWVQMSKPKRQRSPRYQHIVTTQAARIWVQSGRIMGLVTALLLLLLLVLVLLLVVAAKPLVPSYATALPRCVGIDPQSDFPDVHLEGRFEGQPITDVKKRLTRRSLARRSRTSDFTIYVTRSAPGSRSASSPSQRSKSWLVTRPSG
jgi:hypothetical protein